MIAVTPDQLHVLHHTLGIEPRRREPYRNYYVAGTGHHSQHHIDALIVAGLMAEGRRPAFCDEGDKVYLVTDAGRALALQLLPLPPKLSKYDEYLEAEYSENFAEWLCIEVPRVEYSDGWYGTPKGHCRYVRREHTRGRWKPEVKGEWKPTKKEAKTSYKEVLKAMRAREAAWST